MSTVDQIEEGIVTISTPSRHGKGNRSFNFNKVLGPSATQAEVFSDTQPLIRSVLDGYNVCIFTYGQTGSGKTCIMEDCFYDLLYNTGYQIFVLRLRKIRDEIMKCTLYICRYIL